MNLDTDAHLQVLIIAAYSYKEKARSTTMVVEHAQ